MSEIENLGLAYLLKDFSKPIRLPMSARERSGSLADAIKKSTPSLGIPYLGV
jgi:hypothetical protein